MGKLILLNDVSTDLDDAVLLASDITVSANRTGNLQSDIIANYVLEKVPVIDYIYHSDAIRIRKLIHKIRADYKGKLGKSSTQVFLRERNFGVLDRSPINFESDMFSHSRIKAENGESVSECRIRIIRVITEIISYQNYDKVILVVSHPFVCQIAFNALLQKPHTTLTQFWQEKGSFVILDYKKAYGLKWEFISGHNAISDLSYIEKQIDSQILGNKRTPSS